MPFFGEMDVDAALAAAPRFAPGSGRPWSLPGTRILQLSFEVEHHAAQGLTPPSLHPSVPPYVTLSALRCADSPAGPFTLAQLRLVVRAGIRPRALLLGAFCSSSEAAAALATGWGFAVGPADVQFAARHDAVRASVSVDGRTVLEMEAADNEPVGTGDLTLLDNLHLVNLVAGESTAPVGAIVQVDPIYTVSSADRGRPVLRTFDADAFGGRGHIRITSPVTAIVCRADVELPPPRFVIDTRQPAIQSSRRLQPSPR